MTIKERVAFLWDLGFRSTKDIAERAATGSPQVSVAKKSLSLPLRPKRPQGLSGEALESWFWTTLNKEPSGCWEWPLSKQQFGYGVMGLGHGVIRTHRYAWECTNGPVPHGLCVLHQCDNPACCNPDHLFLGTHQANTDDKIGKDRGRNQAGSWSGLTGEDAEWVRELCGERGYPQNWVAVLLGVGKSTVGNVMNRRGRYAEA